MAQLFVSHSSADNALATQVLEVQVLEVLAGLGYGSVFLDFDPTGGLVLGQAWRDHLVTNIDGCDAVVFLTTPQSVASQWCHSELALARVATVAMSGLGDIWSVAATTTSTQGGCGVAVSAGTDQVAVATGTPTS